MCTSFIRIYNPKCHFCRSRFSGTVRTDQGEDFSHLHRQRDSTDQPSPGSKKTCIVESDQR